MITYGFDNPRKALLTTIKEAVDNSLDACEEARVLPEINVETIQLSETRFKITIEDNGPGIVKAQIPKILYSKYGIRIAGGQAQLKGKIFRVATLGYASCFDVITGWKKLKRSAECIREMQRSIPS